LRHVNDGLVSQTYVKVFYILPDWTTLHVVFLEAESEVLPDASMLAYFSVSFRGLISSRVTGFWICW